MGQRGHYTFGLTLSIAILCVLCLSACGEERRGFAYLDRAPFDSVMIGEVEVLIRDVAQQWDLKLVESSKENLKLASGGADVFNMGAYMKGHKGIVIWIGNYPVKNKLSLAMSYKAGMPSVYVDRLHEELKSGLKEKFDIDLQPVDKSSGVIQDNGS